MKKKIIILLLGILFIIPTQAKEKIEMVYSNLDNSGASKKIEVTTQLKDIDEGGIIDYTYLDKIENVNGKEKFLKENEKLTWNSKGIDIYYKGTSDIDLPVTLNIKYYLNNELKNYDEIKNKSGNVKIEMEFINNSFDYNLRSYTPFVSAIILNLSNKTNSNININRGETISNGTNTIITGISAPGLYENIKLDELKDINKLEITFDTEKLDLSNIYIVSTPKLLSATDLDIFDKVESINSDMTTLSNSMNEINDGADKLKNGTQELTSGINQVTSGSNTLNDALSSSITNIKNSSAIDSDTLNQITELVEKQVEAKFTDELKNEIAQSATSKVTSAIESQKDEIVNNAKNSIASMESYIKSASLTSLSQNSTYQQYFNIKTQLEQAGISNLVSICSSKQIDEAYIETCSNNIDNITNYKTASAIVTLMESLTQEVAYQTALSVAGDVAYNTALTTAQNIAASVSVSASQSASVEVAKTVANQVAIQVANSAKDKTLSSLTELSSNINTLTNGLNQINDGANNLNDGASSLSNGISQFKSQGIDKLSNYVSIAKEYSDKLKLSLELSNNYKGYSTYDSDKTIFIYKVNY